MFININQIPFCFLNLRSLLCNYSNLSFSLCASLYFYFYNISLSSRKYESDNSLLSS